MLLAFQIKPSTFVNVPLPKGSPPEYVEFMREFVDFLCSRIVDEIEFAMKTQKFAHRWDDLSDSWQRRKERLELDDRTWIASGQLLNAVTWWERKSEGVFYVGVHPRLKHRAYKKGGHYVSKKRNVRVVDIVRWMEFGTTKMPPRPLFTPVFQMYRPKKMQTKVYQEFVKLKAASGGESVVPSKKKKRYP